MENSEKNSTAIQCKNCGFLACRDTYLQSIVFEAAPQTRMYGRQVNPSQKAESLALVFCYAGHRNFASEQLGTDRDVITALRKPIECPGFTPWRQGLDAKEHATMLMHEKIEENNRKEAVLQHQRHQEIVKIMVDGNRSNLWSALIGAVATLVAVYIGYLLGVGK